MDCPNCEQLKKIIEAWKSVDKYMQAGLEYRDEVIRQQKAAIEDLKTQVFGIQSNLEAAELERLREIHYA